MAAGGGPGSYLVMRTWWGRLLGAVAVIVLVASTLWWWDLTGPVPVAQAVYPLVACAAALVALLAAVLRFVRPALVAGVALVISAVAIVPTLTPRPAGVAPPGEGRRVTVLALNTQFGKSDLTELSRIVRDRRVDVLILTEAGPQFTPYVTGGGLNQVLPYNSGRTLGEAAGALIMSRYPMTVLDLDVDPDTGHQQPIVSLDVSGSRLLVRGVHPRSPTSEAKLAAWRDDLAELESWQRGAGSPLVLAGDFNAAWPHPAFRAMVDGLDDAMRVTGQAWSPTWPASGRLPAFTQIDHVLSRGLGVQAAGTVRVRGTDHLGVWADLTLS